MKTYTIKRLPGIKAETAAADEVWNGVETVKIDCFPWNRSVYQPEAAVKLFYTETHFHVRFEAEEDHIRAMETRPNGAVHLDSCVEWFVIPCPESSNEYVNFEINAAGVLHAAIGKDRYERKFAEGELYKSVIIWPYIDSPVWRAEYAVPFTFFETLYGKINFAAGHKMRANFYKCGDNLRRPHWACWNPIETEKPDFHVSEWFGELVLG
jgi:hypothetical protein